MVDTSIVVRLGWCFFHLYKPELLHILRAYSDILNVLNAAVLGVLCACSSNFETPDFTKPTHLHKTDKRNKNRLSYNYNK